MFKEGNLGRVPKKKIESIPQSTPIETGGFNISGSVPELYETSSESTLPNALARAVFESCPELATIGSLQKYTGYLNHRAMNSGIQDLDQEGLHFDIVHEHTPDSVEDIEGFKRYVRDNP